MGRTVTKKTIHLYRLTDALGNQDVVVVDDISDSGCIGGYDEFAVYHQFDSYELYNAYEWAEKLGMKLEYGSLDINISDHIFVRNRK